jgi:hypothetical protein
VPAADRAAERAAVAFEILGVNAQIGPCAARNAARKSRLKTIEPDAFPSTQKTREFEALDRW